MPAPSLLGSLRHATHRRLWLGQAASRLGDGMLPVALALTVLHGHRSRTDLGLVLGAESLAMVACVLFGGVVADRFRRTRVMVASDVLGLASVLCFAVVGSGAPTALLMALAAVGGASGALFQPAYLALMPSVVPAADLRAANALRSLTGRAGAIAGPVLAGVLAAAGGPRLAFLADGATFLVSTLTLVGLAEPARPERTAGASLLAEARDGLCAVWRRRWIATVIGQGTVQLVCVMSPALVLLPLVLDRHGQLSAYGPLLACQAAGAVAGGVVAARWTPPEPGTFALASLLLLAFELLAMALAAPVWLLVPAVTGTGYGYATFGVYWTSALQREVPDDLLARVFAVDQLGTMALAPVGLALAPVAAAAVGLVPVLVFAAAVLVASTVVILPVPGVRGFSEPRPGARPAAAPART
ncbi:MAG: MFS transporter [Mycobacteriales bacterium]